MSKAESVPYFVKCSFFSTFQQGQFIKGLDVEFWIQTVKRDYRTLSSIWERPKTYLSMGTYRSTSVIAISAAISLEQ